MQRSQTEEQQSLKEMINAELFITDDDIEALIAVKSDEHQAHRCDDESHDEVRP